jgi:hypothetical protein
MAKEKTEKKQEFKLPRYLRLDKGAMWLDVDGGDASGTRLYMTNKAFVGRSPGKTDIVKDEHDNKDLIDYGKITVDLPWYVDTTTIPSDKLSRILLAFKHGILVETDPKNPPKPVKIDQERDFAHKDNGDMIFNGRNKEIYAKLQNYDFDMIRKFVQSTPKTTAGRQNLLDLYEYEKKGYNPFSRPRFEVLEVVKAKLREFGNGISAVRINDEDK